MAKKTLTSVKKRAWKVFSEMIRRTRADDDGMAYCVTCKQEFPDKAKKVHWKELQAGHFIDGKGNAILFDELGVHPQCYSCNCMKSGNKIEYFRFMQEKYGDEVIDYLRRKKHQTKKFTIDELENLMVIWRSRYG